MPGTSLSVLAAHSSDPCSGFVTDLVLRCGRGDEAALGDLFDLFLPLVSTIVGHDTLGRSTDDAVVDAFHRLWRHAPSYEAGQDAVGWVLGHARGRTCPPARGPVALPSAV